MTDLNESATKALAQIEDTIVELLRLHPAGLSNVDVSNLLNIQSSYNGQHKNYLSLSIIGRLLSQGRIRMNKDDSGRRNIYSAKS